MSATNAVAIDGALVDFMKKKTMSQDTQHTSSEDQNRRMLAETTSAQEEQRAYGQAMWTLALRLRDERYAASEPEALERKIFGLALVIATEPSKLGQVRQMLVHLREQRDIPGDFSAWARGQIDDRVMSMALEYAHDAEFILEPIRITGRLGFLKPSIGLFG